MAPDTDHSPATMIMRHWAVRDDFMRWDAFERRYFLTPRGYELIHSGPRESFTLLPFRTAATATRRAG